ncbi:TRAP transporter large permease subunit [Guptibacillus hwajinpoensis]|uniref:TRAP transporter large permease subunit n=1 Tax=Guptibacillus hwajinpoensis TaxID=208199 RepID=UPI003516B420
MIIFAGLTNVSVGALFLVGIIPGILVGLGMMVLVYILARKRGYPHISKSFNEKFHETVCWHNSCTNDTRDSDWWDYHRNFHSD